MKLMYNVGKETALIASRVAEAASPTAFYISDNNESHAVPAKFFVDCAGC